MQGLLRAAGREQGRQRQRAEASLQEEVSQGASGQEQCTRGRRGLQEVECGHVVPLGPHQAPPVQPGW